VTQRRPSDPSYSSTRCSQSRGLDYIRGLSGLHQIKIPPRKHSTVKRTLQFERESTRLKARGLLSTCPSVFSGFFGIRLAELQIDPQLESAIRPKARGLHSIWNAIIRIPFPIWFFIKTTRVLLKTFKRSTQGRLGTTREDFKTTKKPARVPSNLGMIQVFLTTFGLWNSGTLKAYLPRPSRLLEDILLDYNVLGGLSYGHPWATTQVGSRTDYSVGPWAAWHRMAWSTRHTGD
jgi:hypothetical protein